MENVNTNSSGLVLLHSKLRAVSRRININDQRRQAMELVASELYSNQQKFSGSGLIQLWEVRTPAHAIDFFAIDFGPGIENLTLALRDGYSTSQTMGKGLGAISRLADEFDIYTVPEKNNQKEKWHGLAVWVRFYVSKMQPKPFQYGIYKRAYLDDRYNGDNIHIAEDQSVLRWLHLDGLGHGKEAAEATNHVSNILAMTGDPKAAMEMASVRLSGTRGAVGVQCEFDLEHAKLSYCGFGDLNMWLIHEKNRKSLRFSPGVLGHNHRSPETHRLSILPETIIVTASDGIRTNWDINQYGHLWSHHPQLLAYFVGYMQGRNNDDKSLVCIQSTPRRQGFIERRKHG